MCGSDDLESGDAGRNDMDSGCVFRRGEGVSAAAEERCGGSLLYMSRGIVSWGSLTENRLRK